MIKILMFAVGVVSACVLSGYTTQLDDITIGLYGMGCFVGALAWHLLSGLID